MKKKYSYYHDVLNKPKYAKIKEAYINSKKPDTDITNNIINLDPITHRAWVIKERTYEKAVDLR
jgi:hypothetical protein